MPSSTAPRSDPLDLVLHIGAGKTGTSSIQYFMHENRDRLAALGHLYPQTPGWSRHTRLGLFIKSDRALANTPSWRRQRFTSPEAFRRSFRRRLLEEINQSGLTRVLLSDEALYGTSDEALRQLCAFVDQIAGSLRLLVYLRRQDDHLVSRYQQEVKLRETRRLTRWIQRLDRARAYDYYARLRKWERMLEPEKLVVRRFEPGSFVDGSIFQDFLDAAGIGARAEELAQVTHRNDSLDVESVEFLRLLNLCRVENEEATVGLVDNRELHPRLVEASAGPTLTMPATFLDEFMAQWDASNRDVAVHFLGDESGQLFRTPRKTANTTTEQRLDPARLDHFLGLLELPEQVYPPLREIAEREAKVTAAH